MSLSEERMYDRLLACDSAYDGKFYAGVLTTGIYCLPSCKARKPKRENVRFFESEEAALNYGLRACRRCRPDEFGLYLEEQRVERMIDKVRKNPEGFKSIDAMAEKLHCGQSKLNELMRRYYHSTPAFLLTRARIARAQDLLLASDTPVGEIALDSGFESLSAFYDNFRKLTGMTPQEYRALRMTGCLQIALPDGFDHERWSKHLRRDPNSLSERWTGDRWLFATELESRPLTIEVECSGSTAVCRVSEPQMASQAHLWLIHRLGFCQDLRGFAALASTDAVTAKLLPNGSALRIPQTGGVWEGLVWSILGQQVNLAFAATLKRRLTEIAGSPVGQGLVALPGPAAVAALEPERLTAIQCSRAKAEVLISIARKVVAGELDLESMPMQSATKVERTLLSLHGIGPWASNYLMMRACAFLDCTPLGDTGLTLALQRLFTTPERPDRQMTEQLMERFAPYRSLATYHLWNSLSEDV